MVHFLKYQETQGWVSIASLILDSVPVWQNKEICYTLTLNFLLNLFIIHVFSSLFLGIGLSISQSVNRFIDNIEMPQQLLERLLSLYYFY